MPSTDPPQPQLKPSRLHRQRRRRRATHAVLNSAELSRLFDCRNSDLEAELTRRGVKFHRDSVGAVFASVPLAMLRQTESRNDSSDTVSAAKQRSHHSIGSEGE